MNAVELGYSPEDTLEYLPFIEAYAQVGDVERAIALSESALLSNPRMRIGLCELWNRAPNTDQARELIKSINCPE